MYIFKYICSGKNPLTKSCLHYQLSTKASTRFIFPCRIVTVTLINFHEDVENQQLYQIKMFRVSYIYNNYPEVYLTCHIYTTGKVFI